jgi:hypothetical protein
VGPVGKCAQNFGVETSSKKSLVTRSKKRQVDFRMTHNELVVRVSWIKLAHGSSSGGIWKYQGFAFNLFKRLSVSDI